jgi:uncharacterized protein YceH (UPF0502 family)
MNDETMQRLRAELVQLSVDGRYVIQLGEDAKKTLDAIMELLAAEIERAEVAANNKARHVLHTLLSDDVDSELDHADIEAQFNRLLQSKTGGDK